MTVGIIEGYTSTIGESDNDIGGLRLTRATSAITAGDTTINVESTTDWADSGKIGIEGQVYSYSGKTLTTFTGITYVRNGDTYTGAYKDHRDEIPILDLNKDFSAIDRARRMMLVDYAEEEFLNIVGQNLGVPRSPYLMSDDEYREVIKALAYNPRGTIYGMELALDALVGDGLYQIIEDIESYNNTVFFQFSDDLVLSEFSVGKWYPSEFTDGIPSSDTSIDLPNVSTLTTLGGLTWRLENHETDLYNQIPSADTAEEYDGDSGTQVWTWLGTGGTEGTRVNNVAGLYTIIDDDGTTGDAYYGHPARLQPESEVSFEMVFYVPSATTLDLVQDNPMQWYGGWTDGDKLYAFGLAEFGSGFRIGVINGAGAVINDELSINKDQWYSAVLTKKGDNVTLKVDGKVVSVQPTSFYDSSADPIQFAFGKNATAAVSGITVYVKSVSYYARTHTDYSSAFGTNLEAAFGGGPAIVKVEAPGYFVDPDDLGKRFTITGSTTSNSFGGNNNGRFLIDSIGDARTVGLVGDSYADGTVDVVGKYFRAGGGRKVFQFPDDLGKKLVISGSGANDGTYYISAMYRQGSNYAVDLSSFLTEVRQKTDEVALSTTYPAVTNAVLELDSGMSWQIQPNFVSETGPDWEQSAAYSISGTTVTLYQGIGALPSGSVVRTLEAYYTTAYTGQILEDEDEENNLVTSTPLVYEAYPIYLWDPLGFVKFYLDDLTAGGVIPEYIGIGF